jgi:hypothetical protein
LFSGTYGAGDRFRTDDLVLGKHTLYQLSYTRSPFRPVRTRSFIGRRAHCQIALTRFGKRAPIG